MIATHRCLAVGLIAAGALASAPAKATIVTEYRAVLARSCEHPPSGTCSPEFVLVTDGPALFDESASDGNTLGETAEAFQTSTVTENRVVGSGGTSTSLTLDELFAVANTWTEVTFDLAVATPYSFSASSSVVSASDSRVLIELLQPGGAQEIYRHHASGLLIGPSAQDGSLAPGQWTFRVLAQGERVSDLSWSVDFQLVPEPATLLLFGAGLAALGGRRRR